MYNTAHFSRMPRTELPGTRMRKPQIVVGTSLHGKIVPLFCNMVMPGTIDSNHCNGKIWMSTPIAPILSQIRASINCFFVPMRLVWDHTKEFFGENTNSAGPQQTVYQIPHGKPNSAGIGVPVVGSVSHYLGKPLISSSVDVSVLKERAFWLCYTEYYRHEQVQNPVLLNKGDTGVIGTLNGSNITFATLCPNCLKDFDYFTTATISPNYGGEVLLPLGTSAPVFTGTSIHSYQTGENLKWIDVVSKTEKSSGGAGIILDSQGRTRLDTASNTPDGNPIAPGNLYADLSRATAARIDDLYTAMAAQAWYHNANFGSRYFEVLQIHYGISNPDLVLARPEHISEFKFDISVQDILSTAGAASDNSTKLGQPGGVSCTYINKKLYNHSFGEWGFVICLMNTYHQRYYTSGVAREDLYQDLFDLYFPEFANRGDDSIFDAELYLPGGRTTFAYQEAYADRRYYIARATGQLDPNAGASYLGAWALAEGFAAAPTLSVSFLEENRDVIKNALVSGDNGPDYIWAFNFEHKEILPMPAYSKPGIPSFGRGIV